MTEDEAGLNPELLEMYYERGMGEEEIAESLKMPVSAVRAAIASWERGDYDANCGRDCA